MHRCSIRSIHRVVLRADPRFALTGIVCRQLIIHLIKMNRIVLSVRHDWHVKLAGRFNKVEPRSHIIVREGQAAQAAARADIARVDGAAAAEFNHQVTACVHISVGDGNAILAVFTVFTILAAADAARVDLAAVCQLEDQVAVFVNIDVVKAAVCGRCDRNLAAIPLHIRTERLQHRADGQIRVSVLHERRRVHGDVLPVDRDVALADGHGDGGAALRDDGRAAHAVPLHVAAVLFHDHAKRDLRSAVRIDKRLARFRGERDLLSVQFNTDVVLRRKGGHRKAQQHRKDKCNAQCALFYFCHKSNSLPKCSLLA